MRVQRSRLPAELKAYAISASNARNSVRGRGTVNDTKTVSLTKLVEIAIYGRAFPSLTKARRNIAKVGSRREPDDPFFPDTSRDTGERWREYFREARASRARALRGIVAPASSPSFD